MKTGWHLQEKSGYRLLYTCVLAFIVLAGAGRFLGIARVSAIHILTVAAVLALCAVVQRLTAKGRIVCAALSTVFFTVIAASAGIRQCVIFLSSWMQWMIGKSGWAEDWELLYEVLQIGIISLVCYFVQFVLERYIVLKVITADLLVSLLLFCLLTEWEISHVGVVLSFAYIVMVYAEWIQREWKKVGGGDRKKYMLWIMPFVALYVILMLLMPTPEHPYEWRFVRETYSQIRDSVISLTQNFMRGGEDDFDTAFSGFSEDGELRDEIEENSREVMTLQGAGSLVTNVYLAGRIYDTFDGRTWLQENHDADNHTFRDAAQIQNAVLRMEGDLMRNYLSSTTLQVRYTNFRTACLFVPLMTRQIRVQGENNPYYRDGDTFLFQERKGYGTEYEVNYYQINVGTEEFDRFLRSVSSQGGEDERSHRVREIYMEDIVLSESTENYLEELTWNAYDRLEWLRMIEQELSSYTYTRQPEVLPGNVKSAGDFLDFFLLESQRGYCTHFATAFVLLARSQGMPARYVQGFCVPVKTTGEVSVYNDMAHAWPEVYFEGVGWIPFEPTPGYGRFRYTPWGTERIEEDMEVRAEDALWESGNVEEPVREEAQEEEETGNGIWRFLAVAAYAAAAVCLAGFIMLVLQWNVRKWHYRRMDVTGKFRTVVSLNMRILSLLGLRRDVWETLQEFRDRAVCAEALEGCQLRFVGSYEAVLYGEKDAEPEMLQTAMAEREELIRILKRKKKWRYYLWYYRVKA